MISSDHDLTVLKSRKCGKRGLTAPILQHGLLHKDLITEVHADAAGSQVFLVCLTFTND